MKKIPCLFKREFFDNHTAILLEELNTGYGHDGILNNPDFNSLYYMTIKWDGAACAFINGYFYKRYDLKPGRKLPKDRECIPCQGKADDITGHFPHWIEVKENSPDDKWFTQALINFFETDEIMNTDIGNMEIHDGTYECIGKHFQGNPYGLDDDFIVKHGALTVEEKYPEIKELLIKNEYRLNYQLLREILSMMNDEGIVIYERESNTPIYKIRKKDYSLTWKE